MLFKPVVYCILSDLFAVNFNVLTFVHNILTTPMKNAVNVYFYLVKKDFFIKEIEVFI
jgi:hypothetical protein